jgi:RNA polymerase sigma-70 factor (ECF subfamily)
MDRGLAGWIELSELSESRPQTDAIARGLTEQVTTCFLRYQASVYRYVRYGCRSAEAEEITQEAFLRLYVALERGERIESVQRWLFTVGRNLAIDKSRHRGLRHVTPVLRQVWERLADTVPCKQPTCEEALLDESRLTQVQAAMWRLTDLQRQCLQLRSEGLLYREIGEVLGISVASVADAVQRAVGKLRHHLEHEDDRAASA